MAALGLLGLVALLGGVERCVVAWRAARAARRSWSRNSLTHSAVAAARSTSRGLLSVPHGCANRAAPPWQPAGCTAAHPPGHVPVGAQRGPLPTTRTLVADRVSRAPLADPARASCLSWASPTARCTRKAPRAPRRAAACRRDAEADGCPNTSRCASAARSSPPPTRRLMWWTATTSSSCARCTWATTKRCVLAQRPQGCSATEPGSLLPDQLWHGGHRRRCLPRRHLRGHRAGGSAAPQPVCDGG